MKEKCRKVNRNYKPRIVPPLHRGGNIITSPDEIAVTFADYYANISKEYIKKREEELPSNKPDRELKAASTRRGYYSSPDDKKTISRDIEVPARYV